MRDILDVNKAVVGRQLLKRAKRGEINIQQYSEYIIEGQKSAQRLGIDFNTGGSDLNPQASPNNIGDSKRSRFIKKGTSTPQQKSSPEQRSRYIQFRNR